MKKAAFLFILTLLGGIFLLLFFRPTGSEQADGSLLSHNQKHSSKTGTPQIVTPQVSVSPLANPVEEKNDASTSQPEKPDEGIMLGTQAFSLSFLRPQMSDQLKQLVKQDLELIFAHLGEPTLTKLNVEAKNKINPDVPTHGLSFDARGRFWPQTISDHFFSVNVSGKERTLVIPEPLIAAYESAITLTTAHDEAFNTLPEFLQKINASTDSAAWTAVEIKRILYSPTSQYDALTIDQLRAAVDQLLQLKLRKPSILGFSEEVDANGGIVFAAQTLASDTNVVPNFFQEVTLVFDKDHWSVAP